MQYAGFRNGRALKSTVLPVPRHLIRLHNAVGISGILKLTPGPLSAMSYILEALKKSQRERELGRVPALAIPTFSIEKVGMRLNLWVLLTLILAALAVVIALYSSLRSGPPVVTVARTAPTTARETRDRDSATLLTHTQETDVQAVAETGVLATARVFHV